MKKLIFSLLLLLLSVPVYSAETFVDVNLASKHLYSSHDYDLNQRNYGLGITVKDDRLSYKAGWFRNSYRKTSIYALANYDIIESRSYSFGFSAGLVSGYADTSGEAYTITHNVQVMVLPNVNFRIDRFNVNIGVLPKLLTLQLEYKL